MINLLKQQSESQTVRKNKIVLVLILLDEMNRQFSPEHLEFKESSCVVTTSALLFLFSFLKNK